MGNADPVDEGMSDHEVMRRARRDNQLADRYEAQYRRGCRLAPLTAYPAALILLAVFAHRSVPLVPVLFLAGYAVLLGTFRVLRDRYN